MDIFGKCDEYRLTRELRKAGLYTYYRSISSPQDPVVTMDTSLSDLNGGRGFQAGSIGFDCLVQFQAQGPNALGIIAPVETLLSRRGVLRYGEALLAIGAGDCISCPAASGKAHQIANPLDGMQNCLTRVGEGVREDPHLAEYVRMMVDALERIERTVGVGARHGDAIGDRQKVFEQRVEILARRDRENQFAASAREYRSRASWKSPRSMNASPAATCASQ